MSDLPTDYTFNNNKYNIKITHGYAHKTLGPKFHVNLTNLFEESNMDELLARMFLNDDLALKLWWSYVEGHENNYDDAIDLLTSSSLQQFKDAWWSAVADFFDPLRRDLLRQFLAEAPRIIKGRITEALQAEKSTSSSLSLQPEG